MIKKLSVNIKILAGFAIAIACIGYFLFTTYRNAQINYSENKSANYQLEIISDADKILDDIQDMETGYNGFFINPDDTYIETFNSAVARTKNDLSTFDKLTFSDPEKSNSVHSLNELIKQKIIFATNLISLCRQKKLDAATALLNSEQAKRVMNNIRAIIFRLSNDARQALNTSSEKRQFLANETRNNFLILSLIILFGLIIFYLVIISDLRKSERVKKDLHDAGEKIRDLYDHAPSGYISVDPYLKILQINKTALKWLDYTFDEIAGKKKSKRIS